MTSNIDPTKPTAGQALTQDVRDNFQAAKSEIEALQPGGGQSFNDYLAGFEDTGFSVLYTGDLDLILVNANHVLFTGATNIPSDFNAANLGILTTRTATVGGNAVQILDGMQIANEWKQWMRSLTSGVWGAWKLVVNGGAFTQRLVGYADDGAHHQYSGDVDLILVNSNYMVWEGNSTNLPPPFTGTGTSFFVVTDVPTSGPDYSNQLCYPTMNTGSAPHQIWMRNNVVGVWGAWKLVVDGGAFTERLAGYEDTGLHSQFSGDLDDILVNSVYSSISNTNQPAGFVNDGYGILETHYYHTNTSQGFQRLTGISGSNTNKVWQRCKSTTWAAWILTVDGTLP